MVIVLYLFLCWFVFAALFTLKQKLPFKDLAFVALFANFVNTNIVALFSDTFRFISLSNTPANYVSLLLYRSLIIPAMLLLFIEIYLNHHSVIKKSIVVFVSLLSFTGLELLSKGLHLITYKHWNLALAVGYLIILMLVCFFTLQWFKRWSID